MRSLIRVLLATLVLALLYVAIDKLWLLATAQLSYAGLMFVDPARGYRDEAATVADRSQARESDLDPAIPATVFRLGVEYGYLSERRENVAAPMENLRLASFEEHAGALGLTSVAPLPVPGDVDFLWSSQRLEDDPSGVATEVEHATSPRLRHLFLLGAHAGSELARLSEFYGISSVPAATPLVGMHAVLSGVPEPLWRGLMRVSQRPEAALPEYTQRVTELVAYLESAH
jgi:hypothetical protein